MKEKLYHPFLSFVLVFVQFLSIGVLLWNFNWLIILPIWIYGIHLLAIVLGIWSLIHMKIGNFNIVPDPKPKCKLVNSGPYFLIRHPMYASLLLFFIPIVIAELTVINIVFYSILLFNLLLKLHYEEWLLSRKINGYTNYKKHSYKLIPYIF